MTPPNIKEEIIRFSKEIIKSEIMFETFMSLDCDSNSKDVVKDLMNSLSRTYIGVKPPEGVTIPPEDLAVRKGAFETMLLFEKSVRSSTKIQNEEEWKILCNLKK